jgi:TonB family protein
MKSTLAIWVFIVTVSLPLGAQDIRSKVGSPAGTSSPDLIDPDRSVYGMEWGSSEDEFIKKFGYPTGYIRLNSSDTVMLYGKEHAFIFTAAKLSGVRITRTVLDWKLSQDRLTQPPFDGMRWQLSNGIRQEMTLAEVKKILGDSLMTDRYQQRYFNTDKSHIELDFAHSSREGENDEAYRIHGLYIRQGTAGTIAKAPVSASPHEAQFLKATRPCSAEIATWWQEVRTAAQDFIDANRRKNQAMRAWTQAHPPGSGNYTLPKKELDKLDADIATAIEKYRQALAEGQAKPYRAPIEDSARPIILYMGVPRYTEQARKNKTNGTVNMQVEFRSDGVVGEVKVVSGLKDGLDEQAIKAIRQTIFLPSVKDGIFVTIIQMSQTEFNVR